MAPVKLTKEAAFQSVQQANADGKIIVVIDAPSLNRAGSPVFSPIDVFVPPVILLASSLTALFTFGLISWMLSLVAVLLLQILVGRRWVEWRIRRRVEKAALLNLPNFLLLWSLGGIGLALKDWPEKNCKGPAGDWQKFAADYLADIGLPDDKAAS